MATTTTAEPLSTRAFTFWKYPSNAWVLTTTIACALLVISIVLCVCLRKKAVAVRQVTTKYTSVNADLEAANAELEGSREKVSKLQETNAQALTRKTKELYEEREAADKERGELQELVEEYDEKLKEANNRITDLESGPINSETLGHAREDVEVLEQERARTAEQLEDLQETIEKLRQQLEEQEELREQEHLAEQQREKERAALQRKQESEAAKSERGASVIISPARLEPTRTKAVIEEEPEVGHIMSSPPSRIATSNPFASPRPDEATSELRETLRGKEEALASLTKRLGEVSEQYEKTRKALKKEHHKTEGLKSNMKYYETRLGVCDQLQAMIGDSHNLVETFVNTTHKLENDLEAAIDTQQKTEAELQDEKLKSHYLVQLVNHFKTRIRPEDMRPLKQDIPHNIPPGVIGTSSFGGSKKWVSQDELGQTSGLRPGYDFSSPVPFNSTGASRMGASMPRRYAPGMR